MPVRLLLAALLLSMPSLALAGPFDHLQTSDNAAHTPVIEAPDKVDAGEPFEVTITIGKKPHPTETTHFVRYIALYAGDVELARPSLTPTVTVPKVTFTVKLQKSTTLRALAAPNHAAAWVTEHKIKVTK